MSLNLHKMRLNWIKNGYEMRQIVEKIKGDCTAVVCLIWLSREYFWVWFFDAFEGLNKATKSSVMSTPCNADTRLYSLCSIERSFFSTTIIIWWIIFGPKAGLPRKTLAIYLPTGLAKTQKLILQLCKKNRLHLQKKIPLPCQNSDHFSTVGTPNI